MTAPSQNELDKAIERIVNGNNNNGDYPILVHYLFSRIQALEKVLKNSNDAAERSKELEKERDELRRGIITPTCSICNWTNINCLNLGEANGTPIWMCHGCIKRERDQLRTAYKQVLDLSVKLYRVMMELKVRIAYIGMPQESMWRPDPDRDHVVPDWRKQCALIEEAQQTFLSTPLAIETMKGEA